MMVANVPHVMADVPVMMMIDRAIGYRFRLRLIGNILLIDAEHAFNAADHSTDRAADDGADRAGNAIALKETMSGSSGNAGFRVRSHRHSEQCEKSPANHHFHFH
jgi:hypothetical protein